MFRLTDENLERDYDTGAVSGWLEMEAEGWTIRLTFVDNLLAGFAVTAPADALPLTARQAQALPIGLYEARARSIAAATYGMLSRHMGSPEMVRSDAMWSDTFTRRLSESGLAALTARYVTLCQTSRHPARDLADELGVDVAKIHDRLRVAKRKGLFDKSGVIRGKAGGALTNKAREILKQMEERRS